MAVRTTPEQVANILEFDPTIDNLDPFIQAANELVTELCANAPDKYPDGSPATPYTPERLTIIETWLAAHFVAIRDPRYTSESLGGASASYQQQVGLNLKLTPYGQMARTIDSRGQLAWLDEHISAGKRARVSITYLGSNRRNWYNYPWRFFALWE